MRLRKPVATRREALTLGAAAVGGMAMPRAGAEAREALGAPAPCGTIASSAWRRGVEGQRRADLGDGRYLNPVLAGDRPDPNILKDGPDYYATFSSFLYYPAVVVWHSRDLVNWTPIGPALTKPIGSVWALDIARHDGRYFIYIPVYVSPPPGDPARSPFKIYVIHAGSMRGPWSDPRDMGIDGYIDPGHAVGEDGKRYLFLSGGHRIRISDDGLSRAGEVEHVYDGWPIPDDWVIENFALEGPKVLRRGGWFYLFSGEGGTAGPPTSHMVVVARSRSIHGPWENCPGNPVVRTASREEPWWSRGHATPVEGPAGDWWLAYHGYENGFRTLGRQMLLEPFEWSRDGWPRALGGTLSRPLAKPKGAAPGPAGLAFSTDFSQETFGTRLAFFSPEPDYLDRARLKDGGLHLAGQGEEPGASSPLAFIAGDRHYDVSVDLDVQGSAQGGLLLFYDEKLFCGLGLTDGKLHAYQLGKEQFWPPLAPVGGRRIALRVVNDANVVTFFIRQNGARWAKIVSYEVSGYNHNMGGGFLSLRPAIFACGNGQVAFSALHYRATAGAAAPVV
jgi:xylan 1,4-beta-xylosidase